jgi:uncharacterized protein YjbJ (UPF0337 family)
MVEKNYIEGAAENAGGKLEEAAGYITGSPRERLEGKVRQIAGKAQAAYGRASEGVSKTSSQMRTAAQDRPLSALLLAVGIGIALGGLGGYRWGARSRRFKFVARRRWY